MRVIGMGVWMVVMSVVMRVIVVVMMIVPMRMGVSMGFVVQRSRRRVTVDRGPGQTVLFAEILVAAGGVAVAVAGTILKATPNAFDMVVMAFLRQPDLILEAEHLLAIFAHLAVHQVLAVHDLVDAVGKVSMTSGWSLR